MDLHDPQPKLLEKIKDEHGFHALDIEDCLSENQRSKIDEYDDYLFIILHIPYFDKRKQRVISEEVDIFIKNDIIITVHWDSLKPLQGLFDRCANKATERKKMMSHGSGFLLYEIIDELYSSTFPCLICLSVTFLPLNVMSLI